MLRLLSNKNHPQILEPAGGCGVVSSRVALFIGLSLPHGAVAQGGDQARAVQK
jgi:hypothetical protein